MRIRINPVLDLETLEWSGETIEYVGPVQRCGGPSKEAKANEAAQTAFYNTMTQEQQTAFKEQQDIFQNVKAIELPILNQGPNQYGFTPEEDALLQQQITTGAAQAEANALNAEELAARQAAGGPAMTTGGQIELGLDTRLIGEQNKANQLTQEKLAGYQAGQQRYSQALGALTGEQQITSPQSFAGAANQAGSNATSAIHLADSERSNLLSSILGGVVGAGTSFLTGGLSNITGGGGFFNPNPASNG